VKAYLDSSVVLRVILGQTDQLQQWKEIEMGIASRLLAVECLRTLDRLRFAGRLSVDDAVARREAVYRIVNALTIIEVTPEILGRAGQPMPAPLGTLDALHAATAELWRESKGEDIVFATHDRTLALGVRGMGFRVIGV
jgi:predicted nucleic acid-binding protein